MTVEQRPAVAPHFRITREFSEAPLETTDYDALGYMLNTSEVDVAGLLHAARERFAQRWPENIEAFRNSPIWGTEYMSLLTQDPNGELFDQLLGGIRDPELGKAIQDPYLHHFFNSDIPRVDIKRRTLRGQSFYSQVDHGISVPERIDRFQRDFTDSATLVNQIDRATLSESDYPAYLALLDYQSNAAITAFHALTYRERAGEDFSDDHEFMHHRRVLEQLAANTFRQQLQAMLGRPFDRPTEIDPTSDDGCAAFGYLKTRNVDPKHIPFAELSHPLTNLMTADNAVRTYGPADLVIAIPSGGTYLGQATKLVMEHHHGFSPDLVHCPNSMHSYKRLEIDGTPADVLARVIGQHANGRTVMMCDDNTNTFTTLSRMDTALREAGAIQVHPVVAEIDVHRAMIKQGEWAPGVKPATIANFVRLADVAAGISPVSRSTPNDRQLRRLAAAQSIAVNYPQPVALEIEDDYTPPKETLTVSPLIIDATIPYKQYVQWLNSEEPHTRFAAGKAAELMAKPLPIEHHRYREYRSGIQQSNQPIIVDVTPETIGTLDYLLYSLVPKKREQNITVRVSGPCNGVDIEGIKERCAYYLPHVQINFENGDPLQSPTT